jgi:hypothetical protein
MTGIHVARPIVNRSRNERSQMMKKLWVNGVLVTCGLMLLASVALADKAEIKKKAQKTAVTLELKEMPADKALDLISQKSGITIRKKDVPKDIPNVTASLKNVSVLDGIRLVTGMAGFTYVIEDDGIVVSCKKKN